MFQTCCKGYFRAGLGRLDPTWTIPKVTVLQGRVQTQKLFHQAIKIQLRFVHKFAFLCGRPHLEAVVLLLFFLAFTRIMTWVRCLHGVCPPNLWFCYFQKHFDLVSTHFPAKLSLCCGSGVHIVFCLQRGDFLFEGWLHTFAVWACGGVTLRAIADFRSGSHTSLPTGGDLSGGKSTDPPKQHLLWVRWWLKGRYLDADWFNTTTK